MNERTKEGEAHTHQRQSAYILYQWMSEPVVVYFMLVPIAFVVVVVVVVVDDVNVVATLHTLYI